MGGVRRASPVKDLRVGNPTRGRLSVFRETRAKLRRDPCGCSRWRCLRAAAGSAAAGAREHDRADGAAADGTAEDGARAGGKPGKHVGRRGRRKRSFWREFPILVVVALLLAVVIKTYAIQAFFIPSGSMENTLIGR